MASKFRKPKTAKRDSHLSSKDEKKNSPQLKSKGHKKVIVNSILKKFRQKKCQKVQV